MEPDLFLIEMAESEECNKIMYKRLSIHKYIGLYYAMKCERYVIDPFMIPFRDFVKEQMVENRVDVDELMKYMIENDQSNCSLFVATTMFKPKKGISSEVYYNAIAKYKIVTPFADDIDINIVALMVVSFVFDNLHPSKVDINDIVGKEEFLYPTNQYGLTKVNGAIFKKDGLIFDSKGYFYNYFTNKTMLDPYDTMVGFARIINDETSNCDILYRLDERLSMPATEFYDYTGVAFGKFYGPQFRFDGSSLNGTKTVIVHIDNDTMAKLLMVVKKSEDQNTKEEFWHIEIEALPYKESEVGHVITTFLHGMYYPKKDIFTHIDYTKNQYTGVEYVQKYADSLDGMPIDQYTANRDLHYKIWCIENGEFSKETWYKLMMVSLPKKYQILLNEILN